MTKSVPTIRKDNTLTGAAGVFHVAMVFSLRGMIALPTIRNTAGYDIIVTSCNGTRHANIQVKTSEGRPNFWPICKRKKFEGMNFGANDYYVLLRRDSASPESFEGFMLTAVEMKAGLESYIKAYTEKGNVVGLEKFSLCLALDPGREEVWRNRWKTWRVTNNENSACAATGALG